MKLHAKRYCKRIRLKRLYHELVKSGEYEIANNILQLLINGKIKLYLDDTSWKTEELLERLNCAVNYSSNGYSAIFYDYGFKWFD